MATEDPPRGLLLLFPPLGCYALPARMPATRVELRLHAARDFRLVAWIADARILRSGHMSDSTTPLARDQINIVVRDMRRSLAFYRLLGLSIEEIPRPEWASHHAAGVSEMGMRVEFDSIAFAKQWNPGLSEARLGSAVLPFFGVVSRDEVDRVYARVVAAGHSSQQMPEDAFWGARYAIVEDPDGNSVGIMSPIEDSHRRPPPPPPQA